MEFYTAFNEPRPVRLREDTRAFAFESLQGTYGDRAMETPAVSLDDIRDFESLSEQQKYDVALMKIASEAPLRVCPQETVSGSATLGDAINHKMPAKFRGEYIFDGISHLTVDFSTVVLRGVNFLEEKIKARLTDNSLTDRQRSELHGMANVIDALRVYHGRYMTLTSEIKPENAENLRRVPFCPAESFKEAVQSLWFTFSFLRLCGNWPGIGRLDEILGPFLKRDLESGAITVDEAREFLAGMFIKGCEWIRTKNVDSTGDAQHYQNIVLGGIDASGREVTNEVTYLILEIVEELPIGDFPITVRLNPDSPDRLRTKIAEVMRHGGGVVAVYNEPLIIRSMVDFGYSLEEARRFANDGCWEVQVPGKTNFSYHPFDALKLLMYNTLKLDRDVPAHFDDFESLYAAFKAELVSFAERFCFYVQSYRLTLESPTEGWGWHTHHPCSAVSLFEEGCIDNARSYLEGGPTYNVMSPHIGGAPDVGNSLHAIDRLVFRDKLISFRRLMEILKNNWEGEEELRQYALCKITYYGNDDDEADSYVVRVLDDFADAVKAINGRCPYLFPAGVSTFGRQINWLESRCAVPFGKRKGDILAANASPTPGTDMEGATAIIRSYCKADMEKQTCGAALDVKLYPSTVYGENGIAALKGLLGGFLDMGGFFMQLDVIDAEILKAARENPEEYRTLSVRVSGWNARFITLDEKWQDMIIERTAQGI